MKLQLHHPFENQREYLKRFRSIGGFALFIGVISSLLSIYSVGFSILSFFLAESFILSQQVISLFSYFSILYGYYLGYRIFIKKYVSKFVEIKLVKGRKLLPMIFEGIMVFFTMYVLWMLWSEALKSTGYYSIFTDGETGIVDYLYICLLAPVAEEIVFRGLIYKTLKPYGTFTAIFFSALTFGLYHGTITQAPPAFFIGILFGLLVYRYDSLIPSILIHIYNNTFSTFGYSLIIPDEILYIIAGLYVLYLLYTYRHKIKWKEITKPGTLFYKSIAYLLFTIAYLIIIIADLVG